jgi:hypothetical protein
MPTKEPTLVDPATEILHLIPGVGSRPGLDRVACTKRVTELQVSGLRYCFPNLLRRRSDPPLCGNGPSVSRRFFLIRH